LRKLPRPYGGIRPNQLSKWKNLAVEKLSDLFSDERKKGQAVAGGGNQALVGGADVSVAVLRLVDFVGDVDFEEVAELAFDQLRQASPLPARELEQGRAASAFALHCFASDDDFVGGDAGAETRNTARVGCAAVGATGQAAVFPCLFDLVPEAPVVVCFL